MVKRRKSYLHYLAENLKWVILMYHVHLVGSWIWNGSWESYGSWRIAPSICKYTYCLPWRLSAGLQCVADKLSPLFCPLEIGRPSMFSHLVSLFCWAPSISFGLNTTASGSHKTSAEKNRICSKPQKWILRNFETKNVDNFQIKFSFLFFLRQEMLYFFVDPKHWCFR